MFQLLRKRVRDLGPLATGRLHSRVKRNAQQTASSEEARQRRPREKGFTPQHAQIGLGVLGTKLGLLLDRASELSRFKSKLAGIEARRIPMALVVQHARESRRAAKDRLESFERRLRELPELLSEPKRLVGLAAWTIVLGLLLADLALNLPAFEFLAPVNSAIPFGLPLDVIAATVFTIGQGVGIKIAAKSAAWARSPIVARAGDGVQNADDEQPDGSRIAIVCDRTRGQFAETAITAAALVIASVVAIVALRLPALNVVADSVTGSGGGGLVGDATDIGGETEVGAPVLTAVSLLPLLIAGIVVYALESPLGSTLKALRKDEKRTFRQQRKAERKLARLDAAAAKTGIQRNAAMQSKEIQQVLADVGGLVQGELFAEATPEISGVFREESPAALGSDSQLHGEVQDLLPAGEGQDDHRSPESIRDVRAGSPLKRLPSEMAEQADDDQPLRSRRNGDHPEGS